MANKLNPEMAERLKALYNDYKKLFLSEEGKRVLEDLARVCLADVTTFNKDSNIAAYNEGLRSVYLHIKTVISKDIEELERMLAANAGQ